MAEFDFEARRNDRSKEQTATMKERNEIDDLLNQRVRNLANSIEKYGQPRCEIEVTVERNQIAITKKMVGFFLKVNNVMTISVDSQGTFAIGKGDYEKAKEVLKNAEWVLPCGTGVSYCLPSQRVRPFRGEIQPSGLSFP